MFETNWMKLFESTISIYKSAWTHDSVYRTVAYQAAPVTGSKSGIIVPHSSPLLPGYSAHNYMYKLTLVFIPWS